MDQVAGLVWTLVAVIAVLLFAVLAAVYKLWSVSKELAKLNKTLERLEGRVAEQERQLAEVRAALDTRGGGDAFGPFIEAFKAIKSKGWSGALTLLGTHLFRSYLGKRRQRSLPKTGAVEE